MGLPIKSLFMKQGAPSTFNPLSVLTAPIWHDATNSASLSLSGSALVQWNDLGPGAIHLKSASPNQPVLTGMIGGLNAMKFVGVTSARAWWVQVADAVNLAGARAFFNNKPALMYAGVYQKTVADVTASSQVIASCNTATLGNTRAAAYASRASATPNSPALLARRLDADSVSTLNAGNNLGSAATLFVMLMDWTNGDGFIWLNGDTPTQSLSFTSNGNCQALDPTAAGIGATHVTGNTWAQFLTGDIGELFVDNVAWNTTQRQKIEGYLAWKWGLQSLLPIGHPYKSAPPT